MKLAFLIAVIWLAQNFALFHQETLKILHCTSYSNIKKTSNNSNVCFNTITRAGRIY